MERACSGRWVGWLDCFSFFLFFSFFSFFFSFLIAIDTRLNAHVCFSSLSHSFSIPHFTKLSLLRGLALAC